MPGHLSKCYCVAFALIASFTHILASARLEALTQNFVPWKEARLSQDLSSESLNFLTHGTTRSSTELISSRIETRYYYGYPAGRLNTNIAGLSSKVTTPDGKDPIGDITDTKEQNERVASHGNDQVDCDMSWTEMDKESEATTQRFVIGHIIIAIAFVCCLICSFIYVYEIIYCE